MEDLEHKRKIQAMNEQNEKQKKELIKEQEKKQKIFKNELKKMEYEHQRNISQVNQKIKNDQKKKYGRIKTN